MIARLADRHAWLMVLLLGAAGAAIGDHAATPADFALFAAAGEHGLRGEFAAVFADPAVQAGPLLLTLLALLGRLTARMGAARGEAVLLAMCLVAAGCLVQTVRVLFTDTGPARGRALLGAGTLALALGALTLNDAHPTHALIPLAWLLAGREARGGRPVRAGVLLGLAAGLDTWAVLGAGVMALARTPRQMALGVGTAALAALACWAPFLLAGDIAAFGFRWPADEGSVPHLLFGPGRVAWSWRVAQGAIAVAAGLAVTLRTRGAREAAWLAPALVVAVRIVLDPIWYGYYATGVQLMVLGALAAAWARAGAPLAGWRRRLERAVRRPGRLARMPELWAAGALVFPPVLNVWLAPQQAFVAAVACLGLAALLLVPSRDYGTALPHRG